MPEGHRWASRKTSGIWGDLLQLSRLGEADFRGKHGFARCGLITQLKSNVRSLKRPFNSSDNRRRFHVFWVQNALSDHEDKT